MTTTLAAIRTAWQARAGIAATVAVEPVGGALVFALSRGNRLAVGDWKRRTVADVIGEATQRFGAIGYAVRAPPVFAATRLDVMPTATQRRWRIVITARFATSLMQRLWGSAMTAQAAECMRSMSLAACNGGEELRTLAALYDVAFVETT